MVVLPRHQDRAIPKVYMYQRLVVDTSRITDQNAVDVQPRVVIALEFEFHIVVFTLWAEDFAVSWHRKLGLQM